MAQFLGPLCLISMFPLQEYKAVYTQIYVAPLKNSELN